jgi:3-dehydroquinate synthase
MGSMETIEVTLGERSYPILVREHLAGLGAALAERLETGRVVLVTNPVVAALYLQPARASLEEAGFVVEVLQIADGEQHKTLETWAALVDSLLALRVDRRTPVIALGGGVTGDVVGFAAATVLRGVPFVQVPSTLLAMVDASVGGKTGLNSPRGKNLIGAFYQPRLVYAATELLCTLEEAEWRCGLGEAIKHGVIRDESLVEWIEQNASALRARDPGAVAHLVQRCCEIKAQVVAEDERESGLRGILNFGHTVGHALETALGHGTLRHGEAVALGMLVETQFSIITGRCADPGMLPRLRALMLSLGMSDRLEPELRQRLGDDVDDRLIRAVHMDKKMVRGRLSLSAPISMGVVEFVDARAEDIVTLMELTNSWENQT